MTPAVRGFAGGLLGLVLLWGGGRAAGADEPPAAEAPPPPPAGLPVHGYLSSQYRARWTVDTTDQDLYEMLSLDAGNPSRNRVTAHFLGRLSADLDGNTGNRGYYPFDSARDSTGADIVAQVYSGYLDFHRIESFPVFRLGRQTVYETPESAFFDGLRAESPEGGEFRMKFGAYGGMPVRLYESSSRGAAIGGLFAQGRPWQGGRARVDWEHLEGRTWTGDDRNNLMGFGGWQSLWQYVDLHAHYTRMDDEDRDVLFRGAFHRPDWDLRVQTSYYELLKVRKDVVLEADPYFPILADYIPYYESRSLVSKGLGEHLNVDVGMDWRRLTHEDQAGAFNREFDRYFVTPSVLDVLGKGSSISLTEEVWSSPGRHTESQGLDVTCPVPGSRRDKVSVGSDYSLYKYDYYTGREHDHVRTYYLKLDHRHSDLLRLKVGYSYEDDGFAQTHELRCEVTCAF